MDRISLHLVLFLLIITTTTFLSGSGLNKISTPELSAFSHRPEKLRPYFVHINRTGRHNAVLNNMELGIAALYLNELKIAEDAFDNALDGIETIYTDDKYALEARSLWHKEGRKDFKGEPYERAMAYYYRGILYLMRGDYENARASFEGGILQDAFAEEDQFRSDFASLMFLSGWSAQKMGALSLAELAYREVKKIRPDFIEPAIDDNLLLIAETGKSPRKLADGVGHWELVFRRGKKFKDSTAVFTIGDFRVAAIPTEDVYHQAITRGGRLIDGIVKGKANFLSRAARIAEVTGGLATSAVHYGAISGSSNAGNVAGVFAAISVVSFALASNVESQADIRYWSSLPNIISFATTKVASSQSNVSVDYYDKNGNRLELSSVSPIKVFDNKNIGIVWAPSRDRSKF